MSKHNESKSESEKPADSGGSKPGCGCSGEGGTGESARSPHAPVSSEGGGEGSAGEAAIVVDQVAESFDGAALGGELESLSGFDPQRALGEGMPKEILTDELLELGECRPEGFVPETVCGRDDRVEVTNTTIVPWRWICKLIITFPNGASGGCTGWFIGPKAVMTAGHCVYSRANGGWARQIEVIPGMRGAIRPYGSMIGTSFRSVTGWTQNSDPNYDYGCIILPSPNLGNQLGYFGFAALTDASLQNLLVNNSGYPGDKPFGTQWYNAGRVTNVTARKIYYMLDTYGGQSGSPTWRFQNGQRHAVGIHAYGGCPNSSTRIVTAVFNNMMSWRNS
ncbi:MAG: serine protease [Nitrospira sp.]|nr:serine protease [Nitrospira sp.]QOJ35529.1 MAG: serine protease [Nitrospira sp.]